MALKAVEEARQGIEEVRQMVDECRRELGLAAAPSTDHRRMRLFRRGPHRERRTRREAPVT